MNRGDIVLVNLPPQAPPKIPGSQKAQGAEQSGGRLGVVVQIPAVTANPTVKTVLIVPTTGSPAGARYPGAIPVRATGRNGLDTDSFLLTHQLRSADKERLGAKVGELDPQDLDSLDKAMRVVLGL